MRPTAACAVVLAAIASLTGCRSNSSAASSKPSSAASDCQLVQQGYGPKGSVPIKVETVASDLEVPWSVAFLPNEDLLVTERAGTIRRVQGSTVTKPLATISVSATGEGGLLGLALHPQFATNRFMYIYYTADDQGTARNRVERWQLSADFSSARKDRDIITGIPAGKYHNGGRLRFGPDGMLYIGTGDAREPDNSQNPNTTAGKLLRVTADGEIPKGNLGPDNPAYLLGIRNTQGFDWPGTGGIVVTDHGPSGDLGRSGHDEIHWAQPRANLGWPPIYSCMTREGMDAPSLTWQRAAPPGGAAFYTGTKIPEWKGSLLVGTLRSQHLHRVVFAKDNPKRVTLHEVYLHGDPPTGYGRLRDVVMGPDGDLYVTTSNCDGRGNCPSDKDRILRITR